MYNTQADGANHDLALQEGTSPGHGKDTPSAPLAWGTGVGEGDVAQKAQRICRCMRLSDNHGVSVPPSQAPQTLSAVPTQAGTASVKRLVGMVYNTTIYIRSTHRDAPGACLVQRREGTLKVRRGPIDLSILHSHTLNRKAQ
eukprot:GGOE01022790.1.p2 GENE.GGOE01022790.1~~GGOE01022790.1.p2  ORF type:complete len:142 (+),score=5.70 GGOE01022790.1:132-557(+)